MATSTGLQFTLRRANEDADLAVIDFHLEEALSQPFELTVTLASRRPDLAAGDWLEREVTLTVWQDGKALRRVHGVVAEFAQGDRGHRRTFYTLLVRPALWRLSLRHNSRIFQQVSPLTLINTLLAERGIKDATFAVTREPVEREYCVQYRETDLAFIERLAAEEGLCYFHEFDERAGGAHRLVFADDPKMLGSLGSRPYHSRAGGTALVRHVRRLRQTARVRPASAMLKDYSFKQPAYAQLHEQVGSALEEHAQRTDYEHFDYPGRYKADVSGQAFTKTRLERLRRDALTVNAESDLPELRPGTRFTLAGHDNDALNRDWQVIEVVHDGVQPQALEEDAVGGDGMTKYTNTLVLMPADQAWRPAQDTKPRVDGPQVAFVVGPEGEEIHCDVHGRVKVRFPWDRYAVGDDTSSAWIRVAQGWAGGGYGSIAIPRIGHEVIVSFLEGDPDQPLITGRTYHAVNTPPYALPEHKTRTVIRTQTHQGEGFNELRFEDAQDNEQIWIHAQKDLELLTENDRTEEIRRDSHLTVQRDRLTVIERDEHLHVNGERRTRVDGDQSLIVQGSLHLNAGQAWLSECGRELHIKAGQQVVLEAGDEFTLNAEGSFLKLDPSGVTMSGPKVRLNAGGNPGKGSGQRTAIPLLPEHATPESHEAIPPVAYDALLESSMQGFITLDTCQIQDVTLASGPDNCSLGAQCRCG
ncbi:type VI secretion system secreted protein VgrG [Modicisalibacter ilicicola DSM 19980]|uniref:Type VI secretion system secreted protein VgrG n=1 Tax=Modicisalibacter ilicicola DSM 19980 TaxID=1121942 RepID=A0A1M5BF18_9GAMM|nr:type VI secretion system tip protein VgrG [Halomonas ilicicola]SHF41018.1 type VI secretion system secreted protein VgrG [Halomonas ilicicola DSM 19980]